MPDHWPADGSLPKHVEEFVDWIVDPDNRPWNKKKWAEDHGFSRITVYGWMKDKRVLEAIDARATAVNMSPERIQNVMNAIYRSAEQGDMKAAALYLQHVDRLKPKRVVIEDRRISELSDEELRAELAQLNLLDS